MFAKDLYCAACGVGHRLPRGTCLCMHFTRQNIVKCRQQYVTQVSNTRYRAWPHDPTLSEVDPCWSETSCCYSKFRGCFTKKKLFLGSAHSFYFPPFHKQVGPARASHLRWFDNSSFLGSYSGSPHFQVAEVMAAVNAAVALRV